MKNLNSQMKFLALLVIFFSIFYVLIPSITKGAVSSSGGQYFGGKITSMTKCTCEGSTNYQVVISGGRSSGTYSYDPSARVYNRHNVTNGKWVLGGYRSGGVCEMQAGQTCESATHTISKGTITFIATS
jgi:hypothetical protein